MKARRPRQKAIRTKTRKIVINRSIQPCSDHGRPPEYLWKMSLMFSYVAPASSSHTEPNMLSDRSGVSASADPGQYPYSGYLAFLDKVNIVTTCTMAHRRRETGRKWANPRANLRQSDRPAATCKGVDQTRAGFKTVYAAANPAAAA
jgi:hypothetical protein